MVSVCICTINRFDIAEQCIGHSLVSAGTEYELLCVDNGSTDKRIIDYVASLGPVYHRLNEANEGVARMQNQMILRANGQHICTLDNDIAMPQNWLRNLEEANAAVPRSGISGICLDVLPLPQPQAYNGVTVWPTKHPLGGCKFFHRDLLVGTLGYLDEEFHPYAFEDIALHCRAEGAGLINYYAGHGSSQLSTETPDTEYQMAKLRAVENLQSLFQQRVANASAGRWYTPPPPLR